VILEPQTLSTEAAEVAAAAIAQIEKMRPDAYWHAYRVADLAVRVAERAQLPESKIDYIRWGAMLHDIGELNVRGALFEKPGVLNDDERAQIEEHSLVGARWLAGAPGLAPLIPFARWHHERFDGLGYPDERAAHEVPIGVAIVAVCDTWDALTQARPYRAAMTVEVAAAEMRTHAGRQWSRSLVDWLLACAGAPVSDS
jgi:putative nucleotidyltransferase with HDIG domain